MDFAFSEPSIDYWIQECSAATENILLAAAGLGLGSIWIGLYPLPSKIKPVRKILNIPEHVIPLGAVYVGYAGEIKEPRTQYNEKVVYWQQYDPARKHRARHKNMKKL
ncbi:nitroreductase family protein [Clostridium fungisolvens]|uniref:Bifunctional F420 biosynthesis protein FbiB n=1 Tax=Clostridium fungisolvens TaxID=1604897 RepID=A0A6V8SFI7_9CLOT|nr:nitroreductase family protein [Clostridium fungisolvens]GFP75352.1 Bifunctional F420 biosynthesis protein FbiB [Clostridium fungisolvens]